MDCSSASAARASLRQGCELYFDSFVSSFGCLFGAFKLPSVCSILIPWVWILYKLGELRMSRSIFASPWCFVEGYGNECDSHWQHWKLMPKLQVLHFKRQICALCVCSTSDTSAWFCNVFLVPVITKAFQSIDLLVAIAPRTLEMIDLLVLAPL